MHPVEQIIAGGDAGLWDSAALRLETELEAQPGDHDTAARLALIYRQSGQWENALGLAIPPAADVDPARFVVKRDFLPDATRQALLDLFSARHSEMEELSVTVTRNGSVRSDAVLPSKRLQFGGYFGRELDGLVRPSVDLELDDICEALDIDRFEIGSHRLRLDYTPVGGFGDIHQDTGFGAKLSYLYYFHQQPKRWTGGDLVLFDRDIRSGAPITERFTRFIVEDNMLVSFRPEDFHLVTTVTSRESKLEPAECRLSVCGFVHPVGFE